MISVSYLQSLFQKDGKRILHRGKITSWDDYLSWDDFVSDFLDAATYPNSPTHKEEAFGWTPTLFRESERESDGRWGHWRKGEHAADELTLFVADLDNHQPNHPMIDIDTVETALSSLNLNYILYTSFSHKPERHKVRIVIAVSRSLTPDEAFRVFTFFNAAFEFQLDGSIYDPGDFLYGPPLDSDTRCETNGDPLNVDVYLDLAARLPAHVQTFVPRNVRTAMRAPTPLEIAETKRLAAIDTVNGDVSIHNPRFFNPDWLDLLLQRYVGGSRHQTVLGLLTKAWVKSKRTLTRGELRTLQEEMDAVLGGYLRRTYGRSVLEGDLASVMRVVATDLGALSAPTEDPRQAALKARFMSLRSKKRKDEKLN